MILATLLLAALSSLTSGAPDPQTASGGVTVVLPMEAAVRGTELQLGAFAEVRGADADTAARVRAVSLGYAPAPGFTRLFHAHRIQEEIERQLPGLRVTIAGQPACRVRPEVARIAGADIERAARVELERAFAGKDVTLAPREPIADVTVPAGSVPPELRVRVDSTEPKSGALSVPVHVLVDGTPYRTVWTSWDSASFETLPVLARDVAAGERLQPGHLELRRVRTSSVQPRNALSAELLAGAVAVRALKAGEPVGELDVHRPTAVNLGDDVYLEVRKGAVSARVAAVALEAGAIGDRIRVRAASLGQEHGAVVVSRDLVRVDLGAR